MRKFKHKTTGYIATETNSEKNYKVSEPKNFTIPKWIIENSEDWEEIKEFPKIISLQHINRLKIITDKKDIEAWLEDYGTRFWQIYQVAVSENEVFTLGDKVTYNYKDNYAPWVIDNFLLRSDGKILARSKSNSICEIVSEIKKAPEPLFVTEDGIEIYNEHTLVFGVNKDWIAYGTEFASMSNKNNKYFSTKKAAEEYVAKNKPKDLQYYEDLLLNPAETVYTFCTFSFSHYTWLKNKEPKLYWLKVLELVQQDLDNGWEPSWFLPGQSKFRISCRYIDTVYRVTYNYEFVEGFVFFKTKQSAEKAIELMGDKLDIIFK